jgi:membrane protease YdiL (CAAX protease family)
MGSALALAIMATAWLLLVYLQPGPIEEPGWMIWKRALAGVSAGVIEELFFRMGVMTAVVWVVVHLTRQTHARPWAVWTGAVISAVLFAAAHFNFGPALISYLSIGFMCAWLYWRRGLEAAIVGHASFDVTISVLAPAFGVPI